MTDSVKTWVRICPLDQIPTGKTIALNINGQQLILARCGETASVLQGFCTHMLFPLSGSKVQDCILTCSLHHSRFDVRDGSVVDWSTYPPLIGPALASVRERKSLRTFETRVTDGAVYVLWPTEDSANVRIKV